MRRELKGGANTYTATLGLYVSAVVPMRRELKEK